jgi:hypothetical protein
LQLVQEQITGHRIPASSRQRSGHKSRYAN